MNDLDGDGCADSEDSDIDGDFLDNIAEADIGTDLYDQDTDGDGIIDGIDKFPLDPDEWLDSDLDGCGDNSDEFPYDDQSVKIQMAMVTVIITIDSQTTKLNGWTMMKMVLVITEMHAQLDLAYRYLLRAVRIGMVMVSQTRLICIQTISMSGLILMVMDTAIMVTNFLITVRME